MARLEFRALGPLEVLRDGDHVRIAPKQRVVLGVLLLRSNRPVGRDELVDLVWGETAPPTARASLHNQVRALRGVCGSEAPALTEHGYVLSVEPSSFDVARFRRLVREAHEAEPRERAAKLRLGLECWRGRAFPELAAPALAPEIARLEEERLSALEERIDADLLLGRHADLVPELEELANANALRERLWGQLMLALYRAGRQAEALASYRRAHERFTDSLGLEPGAVLRELQRAILVQDPRLEDPSKALGSTLERAASILPRTLRERAESLYDYGRALVRLGEHGQALSTLGAARRTAGDIGESGLEQRARLALSHLSLFTDGAAMEEHLRVAREVHDALEGLGDTAGRAEALLHQAHMLRDLGRAADALALADAAVELALTAGDRSIEVAGRRVVVLCLAHGPAPVEAAIGRARDQLDALVAEGAEVLGVPSALALLLAQSGRMGEARALIDDDLVRARDSGAAWSVAACLVLAGLAERAAGNLDEAEEHFETLYGMLAAEHLRGVLPAVAGQLACLVARRGDARAATLGELCRSRRNAGDFVSDALWRRAAAFAAGADGRLDDVRHLARELADVLATTDWLTFEGESHEDVAAAYALVGDATSRRAALDSALAAYERRAGTVGVARVRSLLVAQAPS